MNQLRLRLCQVLLAAALPLAAQAQNPDLPPAPAAPIVAPAGTLVLAMDNTWQRAGAGFNLKAYGLAVQLLD